VQEEAVANKITEGSRLQPKIKLLFKFHIQLSGMFTVTESLK
jgi:hypothetical protein